MAALWWLIKGRRHGLGGVVHAAGGQGKPRSIAKKLADRPDFRSLA